MEETKKVPISCEVGTFFAFIDKYNYFKYYYFTPKDKGSVFYEKVLITVLSCGFLIGSVATPVVSIVFADEAVAQEIHPDSDAPISSDEGASYLDIPEINLDEDIKEYEVEVPSPKARAAFVIIWKIESKTASGTSYGPWRNGPSGKGKATLSANNSNTSSRSVSSSISGDYPIGKGKLAHR
ncbi:hypothetical protein GQR36_10435 [Enterococcus termitis]